MKKEKKKKTQGWSAQENLSLPVEEIEPAASDIGDAGNGSDQIYRVAIKSTVEIELRK